MKIAVLIPDRNDRPELLANCMRMLEAQTVKPDIIELVNDESIYADGVCDITWRYRNGYDRLRNRGVDLIAFIENDDWYSPDYLETMSVMWLKNGRPAIMGIDYVVVYHLKLNAYFTIRYKLQSCAMNTFITPDMYFDWCDDNEPFTDMHLYRILPGKIVHPAKHVSVSMKHGTGLCGGDMHNEWLERFTTMNGRIDGDLGFLRETLDEDSYKFYSQYKK